MFLKGPNVIKKNGKKKKNLLTERDRYKPSTWNFRDPHLDGDLKFHNTMDNKKFVKASELGEKLVTHKESRIRLALNFKVTPEAKMKQNFTNSKGK